MPDGRGGLTWVDLPKNWEGDVSYLHRIEDQPLLGKVEIASVVIQRVL